ncbi:hypothetical protein IEQ34_002809 [Dendrobium chrysotoxum]|uniref:Uncharacterized protein n=1 Tax=Dendrobium chrysotoxum TaxID=161865 RepID=A0AAV7HFI7_DENCH|nr:hypothetical protein IEQ34_002809 [Dendrobium chrysotoxum]
MPTLTASTLDRLLEPASRNPNIPKHAPVKLEPTMSNSRPLFASPALYATPTVTPLPFPDSPSSFPPSPYIVNHKRRGPRLQKPPPPMEAEKEVDSKDEAKGIDYDEKLGTTSPIVSIEENSSGNGIAVNEEAEDFLDFLDSMSSASNLEGEDGSAVEGMRKMGTDMSDYYDAYDEISSDGSLRSSFRKAEDEIREMRLNLLMEIEKRKQAEDAVESLQLKWKNLRRHLSAVGLVLPNLHTAMEVEAIIDPAEDLSQQIVVTRVVTASVARGCARAAAEMEMEPQIEAKNFEIARLLDRLRYYEATNREMSQRNQEAVERARQRRHRRNRRQKWFWCSIGLAVTLGSAAIAWSYLPSSDPPPVSNDD